MSHRYYDPVDYDPKPIGNSGFESQQHTDWNRDSTYTIRDSSTKETLFSMESGTRWSGRGTRASSTNVGSNKTILGKDEKYYYITTESGFDWGIVQTSGIVLRQDRSVLTTIKMHPLYDTSPEIKVIPTYKPIVPVEAPIVPINTGVIGANIPVTPSPVIQRLPVPEDRESLLSKLIHWIERILGL